ncbi:MAG: hypothetical protein U0990_02635 [Candidatus Nanopelagicales bacterium]|nr:hypothetical protein [Candidatus Nanopelagicales bacterium]MDZ4248968.1 hypothetical protein [Candidatus Nanopelagicales bacterium]
MRSLSALSEHATLRHQVQPPADSLGPWKGLPALRPSGKGLPAHEDWTEHLGTGARLLLLTNDREEGLALGPVEGFEALADSGQLGSVSAISHAAGNSRAATHARVIAALKDQCPDVILVWTGTMYPATAQQEEELAPLLSSRRVLFWEGDAWGGRKVHTQASKWWLRRTDLAFSVAGEPQLSMLASMGARQVQLIPHTYSHIQFAAAEDAPPPPPDLCRLDAVLMGGNYARIPGITGLPGSAARYRLAAWMRLALGDRFRAYGVGWPRWLSNGSIPYSRQIDCLRSARLSVNWDHYPSHEGYASDRLAISLLSGRPQVTTLHPKMDWAPDESLGLFQEPSVRAVRRRALGLLADDPEALHMKALDGWKWVRNRMSNKQGAQFMMSMAVDTVPALPFEPWTRLPKPLVATSSKG